MSKVIDERVVEMRFDNKDFESNVQTSLKTIDKLKDSLNFDDATRSVGKFQDSLKHFSLDDIGNAVEGLSSKFNWANIFKMDLLNNVVGSVYSTITGVFDKIKGQLHLEDVDPISNMIGGWDKYAEKTKSVATIMAATGDSMEYVNEQMQRLLYFSDETSYSFTDMTSNIGKFTANGIELESASTAMQGIATWAARSGQNASTASRVMYNLAQAIGMGALKLQDWKSVELANMGTKEFKEMAIQAGLATGALIQNAEGLTVIADGTENTLKETEVTIENFRETLKDGWLDNETLMTTLQEYGKAADLISEINAETEMQASKIIDLTKALKENKMSLTDFAKAVGISDEELKNNKESVIELKQAFELLGSEEYEFSLATYEAAQEARTFGDAMGSVADYVGSKWMETFELLFGGYEQAKILWTDLAENLAGIFGDGVDERNALLEEANISGYEALEASLEASGASMHDLEQSLRRVIGTRSLRTLRDEAGSFEEALKQGKFSIDDLEKAIDGLPSSFKVVKEVAGEVVDNYEEATKWSWELRKGMYDYVGHDDQVEKLMKAKNITKEYAEQVVTLSEKHEELGRELTKEEAAAYLTYTSINKQIEENVELTDEQREALKGMLEELDQRAFREGFTNGLMNLGHTMYEAITRIREVLHDMFPPATAAQLRIFATNFQNLTAKMLDFASETGPLYNILTALAFPFRVIADVIGVVIRLVAPLGKIILAAFVPLVGALDTFGAWIVNVRETTHQLEPFADIINKVGDALEAMFQYAARVASIVGGIVKDKLIEKLSVPFQRLVDAINKFKDNKLKGLDQFIQSIKTADAEVTANKIVDRLRNIYHVAQQLLIPIATLFNRIREHFEYLERNKRFSGLTTLQNVFETIRWVGVNAIREIEKWLQKLGVDTDELEKQFEPVSRFFETLRSGILASAEPIINTFRNIKDHFDYLERVKEFSGFTTLQNAAETARWVIVSAFKGIRDSLRELGIDIGPLEQKFTELYEKVKNFFSSLRTDEGRSNIFSQLKDDISEAMERLTGFLRGLGITLPKVLAGGGIVAAGAGLFKLINSLKEVKDLKVKDVFKNLFDSLNPVPELFEKLETATSSFNIKNFAVSMAILAGALIALSFVPTDKLVASLGVLGTSLAGFIGTIAAVNKIMGDRGAFRLVGIGLGMIAMAGSLLLFAKAISEFKEVDIGSNADLLKIFGGLSIAVTSMGRLAKVAGKNNFKFSGGLGLVAAAGSLLMFAKAIRAFAELDINEDNIGKIFGGILAAVVTLGIIAKIAGKNNFKLSNGLGLVATATSLYMFAGIINVFGHMKTGTLIKGGITLGILGLVLAGLVKVLNLASKGMKLSQSLGSFAVLIGVATSLAILAASMLVLALIPKNMLEKAQETMIGLAVLLGVMSYALSKIAKTTGLKKSIAAITMLGGIVLAIASLAAILAVMGILVVPILLGCGALIAITIAVSGMLLAFNTLFADKSAFRNALKGAAALALFGLALIPMVKALTDLGKINFKKTQQNMLLLGELFAAFLVLLGVSAAVGALATALGPILLVGIGVIAGVFALFVGAITVLVKDLERLADVDAESAKAGLELVKEELNILTDLAREFQENTGLFTASLEAALVCLAFGKGLHDLATDTQILGLANAEQASESLKVVQEEIDLMMELGEELAANQGSFGRGILASATAFNFGVGLSGLVNDTRILGLVNAEQATAAIEPLKGLISTMIALAESIGSDPTLFGKALVTSADLIAFGIGLLPLVGAEFLAGLADATTVKANMEQIGQMIDKLFEIATKISADASLYFSAKAAAEAIKDFGHALVPIVGTEFLAQFVDGEASKSGLEPAKQMVDWLFEVAQKFDGQESLAKNAETAVKSMKGFAVALGGLTLGNFFSQFVSGERSLEGLEPAKQAIDMLIQLVQAFTTTEGAAAAAETAVESVKSFADGLTSIFWSLSTGGWDAIDPTNILSVIDAVIQGIMELSTINGQISNVSAALSGIGSLFDSLEALSGKGGLFGGKKLDASGIIEAFDSVGTALVNLGTKADLEQVGTKIVNSIVTPITNEITTAANAVSTMAQTMSDTIASFEKAFNVDGNNIAVGFINGINSRVQDAYDAGYNLASEAEKGTRDAGEIQSPSKVFKDLGGFIGTGFVEGIQSKYGQVSDVAQEMAMRAYAIVQAITERMNALLAEKSNELRITPVVDMSGVEQLSSLMSNAQGSHNLGNYQINSETIDKTIQSKNVVSEIKTLHDHLQSLAEHMDNMQIVMDTGALVGATSAKMDGQFGIMSMRRGRGN